MSTHSNVQMIDESLTTSDMLTLIYAEIKRKKIAGHHINSMNSFYREGVKQIATKIFKIENRIKNLREKTNEDKEISEIEYKVEFTDVNLTPPSTMHYKSGNPQMLTPNMARTKELTYSAQLYIDAKITAIAYLKNGATKTRTAEFQNYRVAAIPCMVGSELCNTYNCSKETLKDLEEDPLDPQGYFILKGGEWAVDNLENITNNMFHVYNNAYKNELTRGMFLSKPGDAFENSSQMIIRYLNNGAITIELTMGKYKSIELPFYLMFRVFGINNDYDIVQNIVYGVENKDFVTRSMIDILDKAFDIDDKRFAQIKKTINPHEIIKVIAQKVTEIANPSALAKDENAIKYLNNSMLDTFDKLVFPHMGIGMQYRIRKLKFLGHLINKLLCVNIGVLNQSDRDSYKAKRIHAAGTSLAKAFKTNFNFSIIQEAKKHLRKAFIGSPFSSIQLDEVVKSAFNSEDLERALAQSIVTGNKTITIRRSEIINRVSSQILYHKNDLNIKSTLNVVNTTNTSSSKQNERSDEMRRVHPTFVGYIDISQSADTGEKVGMTKQLACTASVSDASYSYILKDHLLSDEDVIDIDEIEPEQISYEKLAKIFVNGDWIGCCKNSHELVRKYRNKRRNEEINPFTTIVWEILVREIYFWTDVGRLLRPLVIVYNNFDDYDKSLANNTTSSNTSAPTKFSQYIKLTEQHILKLQSGELTMDDLRCDKIIEYISPEEQENAYLAPSLDELRKYKNDIRHMYTHMDIEQAIFGMVTLASPMADRSNAVRNTFYTNHRKQSTGWFALNRPFLILKNVTWQHYCEWPIVSTFTDSITYPNGMNAIVAFALYSGYNCEDSLILNQSSVDCGMFNASFYTNEKTELEKNEQFGNPNSTLTMDIKKDAIYEHIENGIVKEGTKIEKNHVLIVKSAKIQKPTDQYLYMDKSIIHKRDETMYIDKSLITRNNDDIQLAKVRLRANRPISVGDKLSSRTGNKGICALTLPRNDMPYSEDGLIPDIIVNAHSIPTRMAVNQLVEALMGELAAKRGSYLDATSFKKIDVDTLIKELESYGIKYNGHRRLYNGQTGEWFDTLIFMGPHTYQRLQKFIRDENYAIRRGPTSALTKQPLDGKNNNGGLRIGEMEKDVLAAHGTMRALNDKLYEDSDAFTIYICRNCGNKAIVNEKKNIYKCNYCKDNADIAKVPSSWASNLFTSMNSAMNVKMKYELEPYMY